MPPPDASRPSSTAHIRPRPRVHRVVGAPPRGFPAALLAALRARRSPAERRANLSQRAPATTTRRRFASPSRPAVRWADRPVSTSAAGGRAGTACRPWRAPGIRTSRWRGRRGRRRPGSAPFRRSRPGRGSPPRSPRESARRSRRSPGARARGEPPSPACGPGWPGRLGRRPGSAPGRHRESPHETSPAGTTGVSSKCQITGEASSSNER